MAAPMGIVIGVMDKLSGLTITVPSTNGAKPGRNLFFFFVHEKRKITQ
jgi:hypothetical protein